jgi:hypothetical protein
MNTPKYRLFDITTQTMLDEEALWQYVLGADGKVYQKGARHCISCDNMIVMFATGAKDQGGKEIYDGDLLYTEEHEWIHAPVRWSDELCQFVAQVEDRLMAIYASEMHQVIVSGNIYEHKELMVEFDNDEEFDPLDLESDLDPDDDVSINVINNNHDVEIDVKESGDNVIEINITKKE